MTTKVAKITSTTSAVTVSGNADVKRINAQQDLISEVQYVLEAVLRDKQITRREIAARLRKSEATISRALDGDSNLTLKTIADIATALGDTFRVSSNHFDKMQALERVEPIYEPSMATLPGAGETWSIKGFVDCVITRGAGAPMAGYGRAAGGATVSPSTKGSAFVDAGLAVEEVKLLSAPVFEPARAETKDIVFATLT